MVQTHQLFNIGTLSTCEAHTAGKLPSDNPYRVVWQLQAESDKRLEAFIFENLLSKSLTNSLGKDSISFGWVFQFGQADVPLYWFRLQKCENDWAAADDAMLAYLIKRKCIITKILFNEKEKQFYAFPHDGTHWGDVQLLSSRLKKLTNRETPKETPKEWGEPMDSSQEGRLAAIKKKAVALYCIGQNYSKEELYDLSVSRTLINCYLYPWFGKQPMDIDACYVVEDRLHFLEFKRKYPANDGTFGIDNRPHAALINWVENTNISFIHIILVDPLWDKYESPIHLLQVNSKTSEHAVFIGYVLQRSSLSSHNPHRTTGADSGMGGQSREQLKLGLETSKMLGTGMMPERLGAFLKNPESFACEPATMDILKNHRGKGTTAFRSNARAIK